MIGLLLGVAGASFAVALPLASRWYPPEHQGLAMGIAGAGNSGSLLATLAAPRLASDSAGRPTFGLMIAAGPDRDGRVRAARQGQPAAPHPADVAGLRRGAEGAATRCGSAALYGLTFGGFVGFTSFLTTFFNEQYHVSKVSAGDFTTHGRRRRKPAAAGRRLAVGSDRRLPAAAACC